MRWFLEVSYFPVMLSVKDFNSIPQRTAISFLLPCMVRHAWFFGYRLTVSYLKACFSLIFLGTAARDGIHTVLNHILIHGRSDSKKYRCSVEPLLEVVLMSYVQQIFCIVLYTSIAFCGDRFHVPMVVVTFQGTEHIYHFLFICFWDAT